MTRKLIVLVGALLMVASACAAGEDTTQTGEPSILAMPPTTVASSVDSAGSAGDPASEGIQVHGHWTIQVRDDSGALVEMREFDNALTASGRRTLEELLLGRISACDVGSGVEWRLGILVGSSDIFWPAQDTSYVPAGQGFTVAGSYTTQSAIVIDGVRTYFPTAAINGCGLAVFTEKQLADPLTVEPNRTVYVEVEISFS